MKNKGKGKGFFVRSIIRVLGTNGKQMVFVSQVLPTSAFFSLSLIIYKFHWDAAKALFFGHCFCDLGCLGIVSLGFC